MRYWLPHHVHVCLHDENAVWLDVRRDQYIGQARAELRGLSTLVNGWPPDRHDTYINQQEAASVAEQLMAAGLLTRECTGRSATPPRVETAKHIFETANEQPIPAHFHALSFSRFLHSRVSTHWALRGRSFEYALERLRKLKAGLRDEWTLADIERARSLLALFERWQLLTFSPKDRCLEHSLWLGDFLSRHRLGFQVVIGIHAHSLAYHCWTQAGGWILTRDEPVKLQAYLPILVL